MEATLFRTWDFTLIIKQVKVVSRNIILIGVAGVGKTTMGQMVGAKMGISFLDVDTGFEIEEGASIDSLLARYGDEKYNRRMLGYFIKQINERDHVIFAVPGRLLRYKGFWDAARANGIPIHLRGKPLEVYNRQEIWFKGRKITQVEKMTERSKLEFYDYYNWMIRYCNKAEHVVRITGDKENDLETLCKKITEFSQR
jgi:shikimate kinase